MKDFYTWKVEVTLSVHKDWVADGFDINKEQADELFLNMLSERLPYANMSTELDVKTKIIKEPKRESILKEQGFDE